MLVTGAADQWSRITEVEAYEANGTADTPPTVALTGPVEGSAALAPATWQGRVLAALLISTMVLLVIPLITAHFASKLIVDHDAFRHEEQEELKRNLREVRALLEAIAAREGVGAAGRTCPRVTR